MYASNKGNIIQELTATESNTLQPTYREFVASAQDALSSVTEKNKGNTKRKGSNGKNKVYYVTQCIAILISPFLYTRRMRL